MLRLSTDSCSEAASQQLRTVIQTLGPQALPAAILLGSSPSEPLLRRSKLSPVPRISNPSSLRSEKPERRFVLSKFVAHGARLREVRGAYLPLPAAALPLARDLQARCQSSTQGRMAPRLRRNCGSSDRTCSMKYRHLTWSASRVRSAIWAKAKTFMRNPPGSDGPPVEATG